MKRVELVKAVSEKFDVKQTEAKLMVEGMEEIILSVVKAEDEVKFAGAKFGTKMVKGRSGVMNGKEWSTEDHVEGCVKATKELKEIVE